MSIDSFCLFFFSFDSISKVSLIMSLAQPDRHWREESEKLRRERRRKQFFTTSICLSEEISNRYESNKLALRNTVKPNNASGKHLAKLMFSFSKFVGFFSFRWCKHVRWTRRWRNEILAGRALTKSWAYSQAVLDSSFAINQQNETLITILSRPAKNGFRIERASASKVSRCDIHLFAFAGCLARRSILLMNFWLL